MVSRNVYRAVPKVKVDIDDQDMLCPWPVFFVRAMALLFLKHIPQARLARGIRSGTIKDDPTKSQESQTDPKKELPTYVRASLEGREDIAKTIRGKEWKKPEEKIQDIHQLSFLQNVTGGYGMTFAWSATTSTRPIRGNEGG
jgi:hypothetical protein